ncbi:MAG: hypothetical protein GXO15_06885 [Crenarchaeota archaeon]|nr:hypothetical protein [Thermoproteota archaeon]
MAVLAAGALATLAPRLAGGGLPRLPAELLAAASALALASAALVFAARRRGVTRLCFRLRSSQLAPASWVVQDASRLLAVMRDLSRSRWVLGVEARYEPGWDHMLLTVDVKREHAERVGEVLSLYSRGILLEPCEERVGCEERVFALVEQVVREVAELATQRRLIVVDFKSYLKGTVPENVHHIDLGRIVDLEEKLGRAYAALERLLEREPQATVVIVDPVDIDYGVLARLAGEHGAGCIVYRYAYDGEAGNA